MCNNTPMSINVRPKEPTIQLELTRLEALDLLLYIEEFKEQCNSEDTFKYLESVAKDLREFLTRRRD